MTTDHLTPEQEAEAPLFFGDGGSGWGFGVGVVARRDDVSATPGRFGWAGGYGTFRLDMDRRLDLDRRPAEDTNGREPAS
jgi:CubicO group peptidase (beta-lactamase class C family)